MAHSLISNNSNRLWETHQKQSADEFLKSADTVQTFIENTSRRISRDQTIDELADEIHAFSNFAFKGRTHIEIFNKLVFHEIPEIFDAPGDPSEVADAFILLMDYAKIHNINLYKCIKEKLEILKTREWTINPETGLRQHV